MIYLNENNPRAAAWLRELMNLGAIPRGYVDERSIEDVEPDDLLGYTQHHFFAGIGGWPLALRMAGWPDDHPVWTGSCPCQPFSQSGKGLGFADKRHLWPHFHWLISQCRPDLVFGEQVASDDGRTWMHLVLTDLEGLGYAGSAVDLCAAGAGAPHIRQRLYWLGYAGGARLALPESQVLWGSRRREEGRAAQQPSGAPIDRLGHAGGGGQPGARLQLQPGQPGHDQPEPGWPGEADGVASRREYLEPHLGIPYSLGLADAGEERRGRGGRDGLLPEGRPRGEHVDRGEAGIWVPDATHGHWADVDWLSCRDGRWRPVEPGSSPLVDGLPRGVVPSRYLGLEIDPNRSGEARAMRLEGYGNAIVPELAAMFISAFVESMRKE